jgi:tetratricopeptide (TPR) repeat protein
MPKQHIFDKQVKIYNEYDIVWSAIISFFAENNVPIRTIEKASGLIVAESQIFPEVWADCGSASFIETRSDATGTFNVFAVKQTGGGVNVTVNASFYANRYDILNEEPMPPMQCNSTGEFERMLLGYVAAMANVGKQKEAIESFKQAIRINPDDALAHYNLGGDYYDSGKHEEAIESYKQALRIDPGFAQAHYNLGFAYYTSGKYKEAMESYKQALMINPDLALAHNNLGYAYVDINDRDSALEQYEILKKLDTEMGNELFNLIYK